MARINVDDDIEGRPEYRKLLKLLGGDDDRALGMLVRFWRHAQRLWADEKLTSMEEIRDEGWEPLVQSKWAIERPDGFYAIGSEERFAWYVQKVNAGKKGGRPKSNITAFEKPGDPPRLAGARAANPPAPAPAPAPDKKKNIYSFDKKDLDDCCQAWGHTLERFKINKDPWLDEIPIARLVATHGVEKVKLALLGAGFEAKSDRYDPAKYCRITRLTKPDIFELCVNLGSQQTKPEWIPASDAI